MKPIIVFPLNLHDRTLRILLIRSSMEKVDLDSTELRGQNATWIHRQEEVNNRNIFLY